MNIADLKNGWSRVPPWTVLGMAFVVQVVAVAAFAIRVDSRVGFHEEQLIIMRGQIITLNNDLRILTERIDRLDTPLARKVERMEQTLNTTNDHSVANAARLEQLTKDIDFIHQRLNRIVEAIDSSYNQLQEHLRTHH